MEGILAVSRFIKGIFDMFYTLIWHIYILRKFCNWRKSYKWFRFHRFLEFFRFFRYIYDKRKILKVNYNKIRKIRVLIKLIVGVTNRNRTIGNYGKNERKLIKIYWSEWLGIIWEKRIKKNSFQDFVSNWWK